MSEGVMMKKGDSLTAVLLQKTKGLLSWNEHVMQNYQEYCDTPGFYNLPIILKKGKILSVSN